MILETTLLMVELDVGHSGVVELARTVTDVYVSRKRRKGTSRPFAFVRFDAKGGAERAVRKMNGVCIGSKRMIVKMASFGKYSYDNGEAKRRSGEMWKTHYGRKAYGLKEKQTTKESVPGKKQTTKECVPEKNGQYMRWSKEPDEFTQTMELVSEGWSWPTREDWRNLIQINLILVNELERRGRTVCEGVVGGVLGDE
ncbi:hypothetical protein PIB30_070256 [Stylosanthes scabra]|uniref:RRM domain-containing protein n=1 Tax=Stylosanthes scabra TaxID=79078 RepID=A0ABU6WN59_9FABA|nr:hypothetical protein [Stylosanthes scabra]